MTTFKFTAFENADLFGKAAVASHLQFTVPKTATLEVSISDDDAKLSGDALKNERSDDKSQQTATLTRVQDGAEVGNGAALYAERVWHVADENGTSYRLVELEQPGTLPDSFTFIGSVPPAGTILTLGSATNVSGDGLNYAELSAGALDAPSQNIVDIAIGSSDFNILVKALQTAKLVDTVKNATDVTVFAPTDAAFTQLAKDLGFSGSGSDEDAVFAFIAGELTKLAQDGDPIPLLTNILTYHVSPGAKTAAEVDAAADIKTLLTGATFSTDGKKLIDKEPDIFDPKIVTPDIQATNGTIQVIDRVLLPLDIPGNTPPTLTGLVSASGGTFDTNAADFDLLLSAVKTAGLDGALNDPKASLTVFAPTDAAFVGLATALGFKGTDEGEAFTYLVEALSLLNHGDPIPLLTSILKYHVAPGALDADDVLSASEIKTLLPGATVGVDGTTLVDADPEVANPKIVQTDLAASNGIAHVIDGVLLPANLLQSDGSNDVDFVIGANTSEELFTWADDDFVDGNDGDDGLFLGLGNDVGFGGKGADLIFGQFGDDTLKGDEGDDYVSGGIGEDHITGGKGDDYLVGGLGADVFKFNTGDGNDLIEDFQQGRDKIDVSGLGITDMDGLSGRVFDLGYGTFVEFNDSQSVFAFGTTHALSSDDFIFA